jgi:hypothetical protein
VSEAKLAGNGAELVRERALAARIQGGLERVYRLDRVADVGDFLRRAQDGARESLLLREDDDGALEVGLELPSLGGPVPDANLDTVCQIIEGVSHFVYVVERARTGRSTTQLELELQAEVDKWVVLAASMQTLDVEASAGLRARLYEQVSFAHSKESELGERYRVANDAAHRFVRRLERDYLGRARFRELRSELRFFFEVGQQDKLRLGRAA